MAGGTSRRVNQPLCNPTARCVAGSPGQWFAFYHSTIACCDDSLLVANIRVRHDPDEDIYPDKSILFLIGKAFIRPGGASLIDVAHAEVVPGNSRFAGYENSAPQFFFPYFFSVGTISGEERMLDDRSLVVAVAISDFIRNETRSFHLMFVYSSFHLVLPSLSFPRCLFPLGDARFTPGRIPSVGTTVYFGGRGSRILVSGLLAVAVDFFVTPSSPPPCVSFRRTLPFPVSFSPSKKRKFNAYLPSSTAEGDQPGLAVDAKKSGQVVKKPLASAVIDLTASDSLSDDSNVTSDNEGAELFKDFVGCPLLSGTSSTSSRELSFEHDVVKHKQM